MVFSFFVVAETSRPAAKRRKKKPAAGAPTPAGQTGSPTATRQKKSPGPVMFTSVVEVCGFEHCVF
jgi:hypothetical protein